METMRVEPVAAGPMRVAVTGASGLIGTSVTNRLLREGHAVLRLVRRPTRAEDEVSWDPDAGTVDTARLEGIDGVVHLAGENVGERWTEEKKRRIRESRVRGTDTIARAVAGLERPPRAFVMSAGVGIYGDRGDEPIDESAAPGTGFLADVGRAWEAAAAPAEAAGIRVVRLRFGVVLSRRGGALQKLLLPFRLGIGGRVGSGRQWLPWIAIDDAVDVIVRALTDERMRGIVNAVAGSTRNAEFTDALARAVHRPALIPVPAFGMRLLFGEMAEETLLGGQRVEPRVLRELGHRFRHPDLPSALRAGLADEG